MKTKIYNIIIILLAITNIILNLTLIGYGYKYNLNEITGIIIRSAISIILDIIIVILNSIALYMKKGAEK
ncbi:MAG: hypothetical protein VZS44_10565 [Bacilli bacterium]|nr:hypothetical protein [Bacilli bacterium]